MHVHEYKNAIITARGSFNALPPKCRPDINHHRDVTCVDVILRCREVVFVDVILLMKTSERVQVY